MICPYCENPVSIEQPGCCGEVHAVEECYICEGTQPPLVAMPDGSFVHLDCITDPTPERWEDVTSGTSFQERLSMVVPR